MAKASRYTNKSKQQMNFNENNWPNKKKKEKTQI